MNENPQPEVGLTACPKCGGLRGDTFAGTPCSCIVSELCCTTNRPYNHHSNADLKSEVERLKVELKEAQAAAAVMREALDKCHRTFLTLAKLEGYKTSVPPNIVLQSVIAATKALSTTAGTAFLARMAEAEWLVKNRGLGPYQSKEWIDRCDAFLKGEGVKA